MEKLETIGLRDVALALAGPRPPRAKLKVDADLLLNLLQTGALVAGVFWISQPPRWIRLSQEYWTAVSVKKLATSLKMNSQTDAKGVYEIRVSDFASDFFSDLEKCHSQNEGAILAELKSAILSPSRRMEVRLEKTYWQAYLNSKPEPVATPSHPRGRPRGDGWREMVEFVGAYYLLRGRDQKKIKTTTAAEEIVRAAKAASVDAPAPATLQEVLAKIDERVAAFSQ